MLIRKNVAQILTPTRWSAIMKYGRLQQSEKVQWQRLALANHVEHRADQNVPDLSAGLPADKRIDKESGV